MRQLEVMGTSEAADELGISKVSISRMIREERLRPDVVLACGPIFRRTTIEKELRRRTDGAIESGSESR